MAATKEIYILGVGRNTIVSIDLAECCGYKIAGLYHYNTERVGEIYFGHKIIGTFEDLFCREDITQLSVLLSQGDNKIRSKVFNELRQRGAILPTLIHPTAVVSQYASLGQGSSIHENVVIQADVSVGDNCVFSYNSSVTHSSQIGDNVFFAPCAMVGAYTKVDDSAFIGIGAMGISGKVNTIGENAFIGAGSLLTKSVEANALVVGSPARVIMKEKK